MRYFIDYFNGIYYVVQDDYRGDWEDWCLYDGGRTPNYAFTVEKDLLSNLRFSNPER